MSKKGEYIVIEGGDGVGKTTQATLLAKKLNAHFVSEPGADKFAISMREVLLNKELSRPPIADALGHAAARAATITSVVNPAIKQGHDVVSDRSWFSTYAYQGAQGIHSDTIESINSIAIGSFMRPNLLIILDADPYEAHQRLTGEKDYYEEQAYDFHVNVREKYLEAADRFGGIVLDAMQSRETVEDDIRTVVYRKLGI